MNVELPGVASLPKRSAEVLKDWSFCLVDHGSCKSGEKKRGGGGRGGEEQEGGKLGGRT